MRQTSQLAADFWRANRFLIIGLTIPLLGISSFLLILARPFSPSDLLLNVSTDLATIIITIWYVDWALRKHEETKWKGSHKYITSEAAAIANKFVTNVIEPLRLGDQIYPSGDPPLYKRHISDIQREILANVTTLDRDILIAHLDSLSAPEWEMLMRGLREITDEVSTFIAQFASRIGPSELEAILNLRRDASSVISSYDLFRSFLGVPVDALPKVEGGRPWEYSALVTIRLGIELRIALDQALSVIKTFGYVAETPDIDWTLETQKSWAKYREISRFHPHGPSA